MEIRRGMAADEAASRALWGYCFERPGDPFFEWYFSRVYRPEETPSDRRAGARPVRSISGLMCCPCGAARSRRTTS